MKTPRLQGAHPHQGASASTHKKHNTADFSVQRKENKTGMPDELKSGIENLSGMDMSDVNVHYNSAKPKQLQAHAYAQGTDIHVATGQERHLPHEAWHVVQQKQGRVKPTRQMKGKVNVNDDHGLEKEADAMGTRALSVSPTENRELISTTASTLGPVQRMPSTFLPHARPVLRLKAGKSEGSKDFRSIISEIDILELFSTPWTHLQKAIKKYVRLGDAVTPNHLIFILEVRNRIAEWKQSHHTDDGDKVMHDDEQAKLLAVNALEDVLPEEIQYARGAKGAAPSSENRIVASRLEFIFKDALGENFLGVHSDRSWYLFENTFPAFHANLLQQELPTAQDLMGINAQGLYQLAGARINALRGGVSAATKIALTSVQCGQLARIANIPLNFDVGFETFSQNALLALVENELHAMYPELADDVANRIRTHDIKGIDLGEFFDNAANSFTENTYNDVEELNIMDLDELRNDIRESGEYAQLLAIGQAHANPLNTGQHLPQEGDEDLAVREDALLHQLVFKLQDQNAQGVVTGESTDVPQEKKNEVVMAVMTIEKLVGARFTHYPEFIIVRKQGGIYRANADSENQFIRYDQNFKMSTAVHELGHYYENTSKLDKWFPIYLLVRSRHKIKAQTLGKDPRRIYSNSVPGHLDEPGFLGGIEGLGNRYETEYTARYYSTGHTEMMSMFTERLISRPKMDSIIEKDPQAFAVLLKTMRDGALPQWDLPRLGYRKN